MQDARYTIQDTRYKIQDTRYKIQGTTIYDMQGMRYKHKIQETLFQLIFLFFYDAFQEVIWIYAIMHVGYLRNRLNRIFIYNYQHRKIS